MPKIVRKFIYDNKESPERQEGLYYCDYGTFQRRRSRIGIYRYSPINTCADSAAMESGKYIFIDNDIMIVSKEADASVPFTITAKNAGGAVLASGKFAFDI